MSAPENESLNELAAIKNRRKAPLPRFALKPSIYQQAEQLWQDTIEALLLYGSPAPRSSCPNSGSRTQKETGGAVLFCHNSCTMFWHRNTVSAWMEISRGRTRTLGDGRLVASAGLRPLPRRSRSMSPKRPQQLHRLCQHMCGRRVSPSLQLLPAVPSWLQALRPQTSMRCTKSTVLGVVSRIGTGHEVLQIWQGSSV